ncbi:putative T6SS immunity periplasmic lipoprotein, partial [Buttiauxella noackiae]|uniref:putative T6SS immunity periplasmic lipoprotein n=1 Tax=Buttiauxella noackiae TaxID=82992 RepID=UPI0035A71C42
MKIVKQRLLYTALLLVSLVTMTGCPGSGDRLRPDEEATVIRVGDSLCFGVPEAEDYQPADIAINPRGTPFKEEYIIFSPALSVTDGQLCVPSSFYAFPDKGQFIVSYVLISKRHEDE